MTWVGIVLLVLGIWLAVKVAGLVMKLLLWAVIIGVAWWLLAPYLGLPTF